MYAIVGSCDEKYAVHLMTAFISVLENTASEESLHFFCLDGGVLPATKVKMKAVIDGYGAILDFLDVPTDLLKGIEAKGRITLPAYFRIFIADLLHGRFSQALYLDCDMIVKSEIKEVYDFSLEDGSVGAVLNFSRSAYRKSGVKKENYFNSGFLLIDTEKWASRRLSEEIIRFRLEYPSRITHEDQCAINAVLFDSWKPLPLKWNHQTAFYKKHHQQEAIDRYGAEQLNEANRRPAIIHFLGEDKPWNTYCFHPLAGEYHRYRAILEEKEPAFASSKTHQKGMLEWIRFWCSASRLKKLWRQKKWQRWYQRIGYSLYKPK